MPSRTLLAVAQWLWLIGAAGYFLTVLIRHSKLASWVKRQPASSDPRLQSLVQSSKAALGLTRDIDVIESGNRGIAAIFGFFRPRLLLPKPMLERLDTQELRLVILHELVHVRRRDVLLNWLLIALQSLHWFNPAVWLALKRLKGDRELVCDAEVMANLAAEDRHAYGNTLIKLLDDSAALAPSLVPIINHKHEIQRRITMIAQFKRTPRVVSIASAMLLVALGCFTLTRATEKNPPSLAARIPKAESELEKQRNTQERGLKTLEEEWTKQDNLVRKKRQELDQLKVDLQIMDPEEPGDRPNTADLEVIRKLESTRIEALADFKRIDTLYRYLTNLSRAEFKKAVATASPDQQLVSLLEQLAISEQKLEDMVTTYTPEHPDVKRLNRVLAKIHSQIDDRLDGILSGLKAKRESEKARLDDLQTLATDYKTSNIESAIKLRPYLQAKRDLESLQQVRERLTLRILQEKVDAAITKSAPTPKRTFTILGEVQKPGVYEIAGETKMNLLQAIATAGGPTDKGNPQKVTVLRPAEGKNLIFNLNAEHMAKDERPVFEVLARRHHHSPGKSTMTWGDLLKTNLGRRSGSGRARS